jgi:multidrug resistance efflux pump
LLEANNAFERAKPLRAAGHLAESAYDQREQAARTAEAQLLAAHDGLKVAEAEKAAARAALAGRPHRGDRAGRRRR